jgi:hypothetical protein
MLIRSYDGKTRAPLAGTIPALTAGATGLAKAPSSPAGPNP